MRPNRYIILISILLGAIGTWFSADAVSQYVSTSRAVTAIDVNYVDDSFTWLDSDYERATAEFVIESDAEFDVRILHLSQRLYFDGAFAGARYEPWETVEVPSGESVVVEIPILVSISELRPLGGEAELSVRGEMRLDFDGIERDMTVPFAGTLGQVSYEGDDS